MGSKAPGPSAAQEALTRKQAEAMDQQLALDKEMFAWTKQRALDQDAIGKEQYNWYKGMAEKDAARADEQWGLYKDTSGRQLKAFSDQVDQYDTGAYRDQLAGHAMSDVEGQMEQARLGLSRSAAARGINMGSGAFASALADMETSGALAKAGAATMAQEAARREGLQLRAQAAGLGSSAGQMATGLTGQAAGLMGAGTSASGLGLNAMNSAFSGFNQGQGVAIGWGNSAQNGYNSMAEQAYKASQTGFGAQLGNALGAVAGGLAGGWSNNFFKPKP